VFSAVTVTGDTPTPETLFTVPLTLNVGTAALPPPPPAAGG
jgi:hypothetical protein